jgi:putative porin
VSNHFKALALLAVCWASAAQAQTAPALRFGGDFRVRYEYTTRGNTAVNFDREVVRFRGGITYPLRPDLVVRARLATGDPDDPNSTDVTVGSFVNDVTVSLDVASVELVRRNWGLFGGKFTNPLVSTELVWDGDVNPQGMAARAMVGRKESVTGTVTGLYFILDQQAGNTGSDMAGGQLTVNAPVGPRWKLSGSVGYYDYRIRSLAAAGTGDIRSNRLAPGGAAYLSDFDLLDVLVTTDYSGFGERYPLRLVGDYVHNSGATDLNTGWGIDAYLGRSQRQGDVRFRYGYGMTETDAVLAAFSHDNTTLGTNYEIHTLSIDEVPIAGLFLNGTWYVYRPHEAAGRQYQTRMRLNAMVTF